VLKGVGGVRVGVYIYVDSGEGRDWPGRGERHLATGGRSPSS